MKNDEFEEKEINPRQEKAIDLLIYEGLTQSQAAAKIQVSQQTLSTWMNKNDAFISAYDKELVRARAQRGRRSKTMAQRAMDKLYELMYCGDPKVELAATKEVLCLAGDKDNDKKDKGNQEMEIADALKALLKKTRG